MESVITVNSEFLLILFESKKNNKEDIFNLLRCFDEESLFNLTTFALDKLDFEDLETLNILVNEVFMENIRLLKNEFLLSEEKMRTLLRIFDELLATNLDGKQIFMILSDLPKSDVTALLYIANYKGMHDLFDKIIEEDNAHNIHLTNDFMEDVDIIYPDEAEEYIEYLDPRDISEEELFEKFKNDFYKVNDEDEKEETDSFEDDLYKDYDLTECLIILQGLNSLFEDCNQLYIKSIAKAINFHINNRDDYYESTVELSLYAKRYEIRKMHPKNKISHTNQKIL